jgi:hypothetical protein
MYKYSKAVKERLFKDNYMAFLWMYYRLDAAHNMDFSKD